MNSIEGFGKYEWPDARSNEGCWKDDKLHGHGTYLWPDGRKYEGSYCLDRKHGHGTHFWPDGRKYEGNWVDGKQHGMGVYTNDRGTARPGTWSKGVRVRWIEDEEDLQGSPFSKPTSLASQGVLSDHDVLDENPISPRTANFSGTSFS